MAAIKRDQNCVPYMERAQATATATITVATDNDLSDAVDLEGYSCVGLVIPTIDAANITFTVSNALDGTYLPLKSVTGTAVTITAGTGAFATETIVELAAWRFVKVATSAVQTADRAFVFVKKG